MSDVYQLFVNGSYMGTFNTISEITGYLARNDIDGNANSIEIKRINQYG